VTLPSTHYQLSFTTRQAMAFFVVCLMALGLSFFLGLMTGLSEKPPAPSAAGPEAPPSESPAPGPETAGRDDPSAASAPDGVEAAGAVATPPATLQAFEDRIPADPTPAPAPPSGRPTAAEGVWIQVASLTSLRQADALAVRLSGHGYRAQVVAAPGPKGRVYRVRVGPYPSEDEAGRMAQRLRQKEGISQTWIVREGT
jgi:cell division septation protein DedD